MGVYYDAMLVYGYKVAYEDIPDASERVGSEFADCADEPGGYMVTICGRDIWTSDLAVPDDGYAKPEDCDWYIGVVMPEHATLDELAQAATDGAPVATRMYELVMRRPPDTEPMVHSYVRVW